MSIWSSIGALSEQVDAYDVDYQPQGEPTGCVDVATAVAWNSCVRLGVTEPGQEWGSQVMLDRANVQRLVEYLQRALGYVAEGSTVDVESTT